MALLSIVIGMTPDHKIHFIISCHHTLSGGSQEKRSFPQRNHIISVLDLLRYYLSINLGLKSTEIGICLPHTLIYNDVSFEHIVSDDSLKYTVSINGDIML